MLHNLIKQNRTYRRFYEDVKISETDLLSFIELARLSSSPRNRQSLKFYFSNKEDTNEKIFETLSWAGALPNWKAPQKGERPSAYIIILGDNSILPKVEKSYHEVASGIVAQSIMLGATEKGFGGCIIAAIKRKQLKECLELPEYLDVLLVLAIGKPKENVILTEMPEDGNYNYWRDEKQNHYVPKRSLEEIIVK
ncbi:MAG: nitroreductase family protein [Chlorobi bacterium]|nr:nitroreductase family protein [Chlorobiota bacterium]